MLLCFHACNYVIYSRQNQFQQACVCYYFADGANNICFGLSYNFKKFLEKESLETVVLVFSDCKSCQILSTDLYKRLENESIGSEGPVLPETIPYKIVSVYFTALSLIGVL